MAALADLALRRPGAVLAANLALLAVAVIVAAGAPGRLGVGSLAIGEQAVPSRGQHDLLIATRGRTPVRSGPYRVALRVITAHLRSNPDVGSVRQGPEGPDGRSTYLSVSLTPSEDGARQRAVQSIEAEVDPGPLRVTYGGDVAAQLQARHDLSGDLWKLELPAMALAVILVAVALGPRLGLATAIAGVTAIAGALAALRVVGGVTDVSLLGIAPAAVLGLVVGVEAPCLLAARIGDEAVSSPPEEAIRRGVSAAGGAAVTLALGAVASLAGLLATTLEGAGSMVLGCSVAVSLALGSSLVCVPALLARTDVGRPRPAGLAGEERLAWVPRVLAGYLSRSRVRTGLVAVLAAAAMVGLALPLMHASSRPFSAADLPAGSQAARAERIAGRADSNAGTHGQRAESPRAASLSGDGSVFGKLPLAAALSCAGLALVLAIFLSPRAIPVAIVSLLPAAAACGLCVLIFQDGHLAAAIGQRRQGALETGAVASLLAALVSVSATRAVTAVRAARSESALGLRPAMAAETAASLTVPAAILATLAGAAGAAVLAGSDLYPAREFGLAVGAGLVLDLLLLRVPLLAGLVRWGGRE